MSADRVDEIEQWILARDPSTIAQLLVLCIERERGGKLPDGKFTIEVDIDGNSICVSLFQEDDE